MILQFHILDTVKNYQAIYEEDYSHTERSTIEFLWQEGNYACDCNRGNFLYGPTFDSNCGDNRFEIVKLIIKETGLEIIIDPETQKWTWPDSIRGVKND
jgi:hypothetical protein